MEELAGIAGLVILGGIAVFALAGHSRSRYIAKYGPPPRGHHLGTFKYFALWSLIYVLLGWQFLNLLTDLPIVLLLVYVLAALLDAVTLGFVNIYGLLGFKEIGWSRKQQVRDSLFIATLFVCPVVLLVFHLNKAG